MDRFTDSFLTLVSGKEAVHQLSRSEKILGRSFVQKHADHDQSSHGNWAGNNQNPSGNPFDLFGLSDNYQTFHRPAQGKDGGASLDDLTNGIYPDDVYSPRAVQIFSTGYKELDIKAHALIMEYKGKPDKEIRIYRAVPKKVDAKINTGDWVTPIKEYAEGHGESNLNNDYQILYRDVKAKEIFTSGDSWLEWGYAPEVVAKHAMHDQSSHGNWATGQKGGSGLSHREMFNLKRNRQDPLVEKVYKAEEKNHSQIQDEDTKSPTAPKRADFDTYLDYKNSYKKYSKDFLDYSRKVTTNIISPTAKKHLDGTPSGVSKYVKDVIKQDWFVEQFGDGGSAGNPEVKVLSLAAAGSYSIGFKNDIPFSIFKFERGFTKNEPTMIHEIAHYATTISATSPHDGHGVEFLRNQIYIAGKVMGDSFANQLENSYREAGISLGD